MRAEQIRAMKAGEEIEAGVSSWNFGGSTAQVFDKHISKSVPGYQAGQQLIGVYSDYFINTTPLLTYDIGCSTGTLLQTLEARHCDKKRSYVGIDNMPEMIEVASAKEFKSKKNVSFKCADLVDFNYEECSIITSYYTLQFIKTSMRQMLVNKLYAALAWGGAFFVFEKTRGSDGRFQEMHTHCYGEYKLEQGYSPSEIFAKSRSLAGVMEPFSERGNIDMFIRAGFSDIECIFSYMCFRGWLCIK